MLYKASIFLFLIPCIFAQTASQHVPSLITKLGPIPLKFHSNNFGGDPLALEIPDKFLPKFVIKWSSKVTRKDERLSRNNCPKTAAVISVWKTNASSTDMKAQEHVVTRRFWITPSEEDFTLNLNIHGTKTDKYYISSFLVEEVKNEKDVNGRHIPGYCVYTAQALVVGYKKNESDEVPKNGRQSDIRGVKFVHSKDSIAISTKKQGNFTVVRSNEPALKRARRSFRREQSIFRRKRDIPISRQLLNTLPLSLSNIIFLPCGILAIAKRYYSESVLYFFLMISSAFYHACDNHYQIEFCIIPYKTLQFCDFFGALAAMWVTLIAMAKLPFRLESFCHVLGIMVIGVLVTYNRFSVITGLIPIVSGLLILAFKCGKEIRKNRSCYPPKRDWLCSIIPGALCSIAGFVLFGLSNSSNYVYFHSLWHLLMGFTILFLIPKQKKFSWYHQKERLSTTQLQIGSPDYQELLNDTTAVDMDSLLDQQAD